MVGLGFTPSAHLPPLTGVFDPRILITSWTGTISHNITVLLYTLRYCRIEVVVSRLSKYTYFNSEFTFTHTPITGYLTLLKMWKSTGNLRSLLEVV